jgi:D-alanyl-D-alanine carboxypeptidase
MAVRHPIRSAPASLVVASLLAAAPSLATAQSPAVGPPPSAAALTVLVDSVVRSDFLAQGVPSVSVVVTRGGETLVRRAWGLADVAAGRAADPSTVYRIASNSKQFTAALVLRQVDRGKLSLGDSLGRFLTRILPEWNAITIEQLLNHTSGLPADFRQLDRRTESRSVDSLVAMAAQASMASRPGTTYLYSNTGYMLLAALVEKLYGRPYAVALREEIARPLGLTTLRYCEVENDREATAYQRSFDGTSSPTAPIHPSQTLGNGGVCATASDLAKWNRALHGGRVLSASSYAAMTTPRGAAAPQNYGLGVYVRPAPWGSPAIVHGGQTTGYTAENGWYPAESLSVTVLYNAGPRVPGSGTDVIAALALGRTPRVVPKAAPTGVATPATSIVGDEAQRKFVGDYEVTAGNVFHVTFEGGSFHIAQGDRAGQPLVHEAGATFAVGRAGSTTTTTFLANADGEVVGMLIRLGGAERALRKIR